MAPGLVQLLVDDPALAATVYIKTPYLYRRPAKLPLTCDREAAPKVEVVAHNGLRAGQASEIIQAIFIQVGCKRESCDRKIVQID